MATERYNHRNRNGNGRPLWEPNDSYEDPDRVSKFRRSDAPIYTRESPNDDSRNWIHEVEAIMAASSYRQMSWVSLAIMQLRGEAEDIMVSIYRDVLRPISSTNIPSRID